jgi:hypothetical protein
MFHYFKIPYLTCNFFTKFTYNEYIGPYSLSHVVLRFSPSDLPEHFCTALSRTFTAFDLQVFKASKNDDSYEDMLLYICVVLQLDPVTLQPGETWSAQQFLALAPFPCDRISLRG